MKEHLKGLSRGLLLFFAILGILIAIDGLLSMRSEGPNPFILEIAVGLILMLSALSFRKRIE